MRGAAVENAEMDVGARGLRKSLEEILDELGLEIADQARGEFRFDDTESAAAKIDSGRGESFVHGHEEIAGPEDAFAIPEGGIDGLTESNADVFDGVMLIDVEIAGCFEAQIEPAVAGDKVEHMVEKGDAGGDFGFAAAVEIQAEGDFGFFGDTRDGGGSGHGDLSVLLPEQAKKFVEFGLCANGDASETGAEIFAAFADEDVVTGEFAEEGWTSSAKIGEQEICGGGEDADPLSSQFGGEPCAAAPRGGNVTGDGFALLAGGNGGDERGHVDGIRRHGAADHRERSGVGNDGAKTESGQSRGLGESARNKKMRVLAGERNGVNAGEFGIGLVENDDGVGRGTKELFDFAVGNESAGGIVGIGEKEYSRFFLQGGEREGEGELHLRAVTQRLDAGTGNFRVVAIHREGRLANEDMRTRLDEGVKEYAQCVIAAIREQEFFWIDAEIAGQFAIGSLVFRVGRNVLSGELADGFECGCAAARRVLVEVKANLAETAFGGRFVGLAGQDCLADGEFHLHRRTSTALA